MNNYNHRFGQEPKRSSKQQLFQFKHALYVCIINTFLTGCPYPIVNWVEVQAVWMSEIKQNKVRFLSTQLSDSFTSTMCKCSPDDTHLNGINFMTSHFTKPKWADISICTNHTISCSDIILWGIALFAITINSNVCLHIRVPNMLMGNPMHYVIGIFNSEPRY